MDYSSLTDAQQLYQQFQQYQQQQQQQQQSQSQPYDPSQSQPQPQSYDHYYQQQQYQPDYTNAYYQQQNDATPIQPPGVSAPEPHTHQQYPAPSPGLNPAAAAAVAALSQLTQFAGTMDAAERAMASMHDSRHWHGKYGPGGPMPMPMPPPYMAHYGDGGYHHHGPYPGHRGGRAPQRGGGRRGGGGSFRGGGGQGNFGHHPSRTDGSGQQFRGRGRGKGGNRGGKRGVSSHPETAPTGELASEQADVGTSTVMQGETPLTATIPPAGNALRKTGPSGRASSTRKQPQIAWCELCRVDCTSLDILEQHKNGKKHKKNLQRFDELQKTGNPMPMTLHSAPAPAPAPALLPAPAPMLGTENTTNFIAPDPTLASDPSLSLSLPSEVSTTPKPDVQNQPESLPEPKLDELAPVEKVEGGVTNNTAAPESMLTEANDDANKVEPEQKNDTNVGHPEVKDGEPSKAPGKKRRLERFDNRKRGMNKKMMRGCRGAKRMRTFDRPTRAVEPPKPKEVVPILCDLCNVKCDTAAVFQTHLGGKKHISKLKRFQGHQARFGPLGVQALYPPNPNTQPIFIPQAHHQTIYPPQGHFHQSAPYAPPHAQGATFSELQSEQNPENHGAQVTWDASQNDMPLEFKVPDSLASKVSDSVSSATTSQNTTFPGIDTKMDSSAATSEEVPA